MNWTDPEVIVGLATLGLIVLGALAKLTPTKKDDEAVQELQDGLQKARPFLGLFKRKDKK